MLLIPVIAIAQSGEAGNEEKSISFRKHSKILAKQQIIRLHEGALFIRLQTKKRSIEALRRTGKENRAGELQNHQLELNKEIIQAFRLNFDFCPVYFFFSDQSPMIKKGNFEQITFLNDSLLPDTAIKFDRNSFLTAEFSTIKQDTIKYYSHTSYEPDGSLSLKKVRHYYGGPNLGFEALIIKSDQFIQLRDPFPYYVKTFDSISFARRFGKTVYKMNKRLHRFYKKKVVAH